jgi:hypothetical protein
MIFMLDTRDASEAHARAARKMDSEIEIQAL